MPAAAAWVSVGELRDADVREEEGLGPRELRAMRRCEGFREVMRGRGELWRVDSEELSYLIGGR